MFKYKWLSHPLFKYGLTLLVLTVFGSIHAELDYQAKNNNKSAATIRTIQQETKDNNRTIFWQLSSNSQPIDDHPKWWEYDDLRAQQQMADWTVMIAILTATGVILLWMTLRETNETAKHAQAMLEQQGDTDRRQLRAYLDISKAEIAVSLKEDSIYEFRLDILVKNYGSTPTKDFTYNTKAKFNDFALPIPIREDHVGPLSSSKNAADFQPGQAQLIQYEFELHELQCEMNEERETRCHLHFMAAYLDYKGERHDINTIMASERFTLYPPEAGNISRLVAFSRSRRGDGMSRLSYPGEPLKARAETEKKQQS